MKQSMVQKTVKNMLNVALAFQIVYMSSIAVITVVPRIFLQLGGLSGNYDFPFDSIHFGDGMICTVLFVVLYVVLSVRVKQQKKMGAGIGVLLGIYTYATCFGMNVVSGFLYSNKLNRWTDQAVNFDTMTATIGENVAGAAIISSWCGWVRVWFFTAIMLILIAYGIYVFNCRKEYE